MNLINKIDYKLSYRNFKNLYKIIYKYIQRTTNYKNINLPNLNCENIIDIFFNYISDIQYYWLNNNENPMELDYEIHY